MFEQASRLKLRFDTTLGKLTTEDLWDLPLSSRKGVSLDGIAIALSKKVKEEVETSFVKKRDKANARLELKFNLVKHIIDTRLAEMDKAEQSAVAKTKRDAIDEILVAKESDALKGMSVEELEKMKAEL